MSKPDPRRDAAGIGPYARERERLVPLGTLNGWNVGKGDADIRGWEVRTLSGRVLGHVRELLVDPDSREVVMLDVDLTGTDRHADVPLRVVEIDRGRRIVRADSGDLAAHEPTERDATPTVTREPADVRYAGSDAERIVQRRPVVEETVVRRREAKDA